MAYEDEIRKRVLTNLEYIHRQKKILKKEKQHEETHPRESPMGITPTDPRVQPNTNVLIKIISAQRCREENIGPGEGHEPEVSGEVDSWVGGFAEDGLEGSALFHEGSD